ncbi:MAG: hypothetical protein HC904_10805 [Blastochloris sp.]|nr:hypothetical protein [Blastochloris sp.]
MMFHSIRSLKRRGLPTEGTSATVETEISERTQRQCIRQRVSRYWDLLQQQQSQKQRQDLRSAEKHDEVEGRSDL